jgi:hypothetical protein
MAGMSGKRVGIRAEARAEIERQARLRQDTNATVEALRALVAELNEADVATRLVMQPTAYGQGTIEAVLKIPPVHPVEGKGIPAWPDTGLEAVAYEISIDPKLGYIEFQGPLSILADGTVERLEDYEDPASCERFRIEKGPGYPAFEDFVRRVRELAIMREVSLQAAAPSMKP